MPSGIRDVLVVLVLYVVSWPVISGTVARLHFVWLSSGADALPWVDQRYADHPLLTALHLMPGLLFFAIAPLQFWPALRRTRRLHRWLGRAFMASGFLSGIGVLWMVVVFPAVGGLLTQVVTFVIVGGMLGFMAHAWRAIRARRLAVHRAAIIRAYALGLSVSTARIVIDLAAWLWSTPFLDSFVFASALGVGVNVAVAEVILHRPSLWLFGAGGVRR